MEIYYACAFIEQVLDLIHNLEVVEALMSDSVSSLEDWGWAKQLRYYITPNKEGVQVFLHLQNC